MDLLMRLYRNAPTDLPPVVTTVSSEVTEGYTTKTGAPTSVSPAPYTLKGPTLPATRISSVQATSPTLLPLIASTVKTDVTTIVQQTTQRLEDIPTLFSISKTKMETEDSTAMSMVSLPESAMSPLMDATTYPPEDKSQAMDDPRWNDPRYRILYMLDLAVPISVAIFGLILVLLILGLRSLRGSKLCWHILGMILALFVKALVLIPIARSAITDRHGWQHGTSACHLYHLLNYLQMTVLPVTLVCICVDRLFFCFRQDVYRSRMSAVLTGSIIAFVWVVSFANAAGLTYGWSSPEVSRTRRSIVVAGGGRRRFMFCDQYPNQDRMTFIDVGLFAVPTCLNFLLIFVTFGACCTRRKMFFEDRRPVGHALLLLILLNITYGLATISRFYGIFTWHTQLIHAGRALNILFVTEIIEKVVYLVLPVILLFFVQDIREGVVTGCRKGCCADGEGERSRLVRPR